MGGQSAGLNYAMVTWFLVLLSLFTLVLRATKKCFLFGNNIKFNSISEKMESNQTKIRTLTQTRDTLLPKLMSGGVRVNL